MQDWTREMNPSRISQTSYVRMHDGPISNPVSFSIQHYKNARIVAESLHKKLSGKILDVFHKEYPQYYQRKPIMVE